MYVLPGFFAKFVLSILAFISNKFASKKAMSKLMLKNPYCQSFVALLVDIKVKDTIN